MSRDSVQPPCAPRNLPAPDPRAVQLVDAFYREMDRQVYAHTIRAMHDADLVDTRAVLARFLSSWFSASEVAPTPAALEALQRRHRRFHIHASARDAWMRCMRQALALTVQDRHLRERLAQRFALWADAMRESTSEAEPSGTP